MTLTLRKALPRDIGHVLSLAQHGARHGHFDARICDHKSKYRDYLISAIASGRDPWGHDTAVDVVEWAGQAIGATVVTEALGTPDRGVEISMIAIKPHYRGHGYGHLVLDTLLSRYLDRGSVYARCMPASAQLQQMLRRRDFAEVGATENYVILHHPVVNLVGAMH